MTEKITRSYIGEYFDICDAGFAYTESNKAFEIYSSTHSAVQCVVNVVNESYCYIGDSIDDAVEKFKSGLTALSMAAKQKKAEGCEPGEGRLILQSRRPVEISEREDGKIQLSWRGRFDNIPPQCNAILIMVH